MPFAPRIRKEILQALEKSIIPALWKQPVPLGYVMPPFRFPAGISGRLLSSSQPRAEREGLGFPVEARWRTAHVHSVHYPYLSFIYEGVADERTLVTKAQKDQFKIAGGIYALRWQAPGALLFPRGAPHNDGDIPFWEDAASRPPAAKVLEMVLGDDINVHICVQNMLDESSSHSLQFSDLHCRDLARLFCEELYRASADRQDTAQALLLALMLRMRDYLQSRPVKVANTSYPRVVLPQSFNSRHEAAWQKIVHFVQMHLHEQISITTIAQKVDISATRLNSLSHQFCGVSLMRYVRQQRIAAAKAMLRTQPESIKEIAMLLNFKSAAAFCSVFRKETGLTPKQFRRQAR